ncbi:MAG: hypothetical protein K9L17_09235 [Clostridiales bacterium]|nr:hypothetical protein [Clostridiales bacterium]MCF8022861.1 hypothetical protein [Clostridiales bacterium]
MGCLWKTWLDVPDADDKEELTSEFKKFFGADWDDVLIGARNPFVYHKDWKAYFAVSDLEAVSGLNVLDLAAQEDIDRTYNVIIGS